jgi:hypothetical protein
MQIAESDYLAMDGSIARVSYLQRGTERCSLIGLRSTMWRKPPVFFGSSREAETHYVGYLTGITAPSVKSLGNRVVRQNANSSSDQDGLWLWNLGGSEWKGKVTPVLIHLRINLGAPILAQNRRCYLILCCRPVYGKTLSGLSGNPGCHLPSLITKLSLVAYYYIYIFLIRYIAFA